MAIKNLEVIELKTGLYGRQILSLNYSKEKGNIEVPAHHFSSGDIVLIKSKQNFNSFDEDTLNGIVYKITYSKILIALTKQVKGFDNDSNTRIDNFMLNYECKKMVLVKIGNDTTFKRMEKALKVLETLNVSKSINSGLAMFFGNNSSENLLPIKNELQTDLLHYYSGQNLNPNQIKAVLEAKFNPNLFMIHGPPGTGKTTVLVEYIAQAVFDQKQKVLACTPSNVALDNLLENLSQKVSPKLKMIRIGHPIRINENLLNYSLDEIFQSHEAYHVVRTMYEDMDKMMIEMRKTKDKSKYFALRKELQNTKNELKFREAKALSQVIKEADVVLATCTSSDDKCLNGLNFDVVVIDEAAQGLDPIVLIPMLKSKFKIILAGDHQQLQPTIKSRSALKQNLCTSTFFERSISKMKQYSILLNIQYRMNSRIMNFPSQNLYQGKLQPHQSVASHQLSDLLEPSLDTHKSHSQILSEQYLKNPLILVDTLGCYLYETGDENESKYNEGEAHIVSEIVNKLILAGIKDTQIGIISPYNAQVDLLIKLLKFNYKGLDINTVDSFQGREKECIIYTLVRSNDTKNIGFLSSDQRTNVALTRAKRLLVIITDTETTGSHQFLKNFYDYCMEFGEYWSASEFLESSKLDFSSQPYSKSNKAKLNNKPKSFENSKQILDKSKKAGNESIDYKKINKIQVKEFQNNEGIEIEDNQKEKFKNPFLDLETELKSNFDDFDKSNFIESNSKSELNSKTDIKFNQDKISKNKKKSTLESNSNISNLNEDELLDQIIKSKNKCHLSSCKQSTKLFNGTCKFCRNLFCIAHSGPEAHGCSQEAKKQALNNNKKLAAQLKKNEPRPIIDSRPKLKNSEKAKITQKLQNKVRKEIE